MYSSCLAAKNVFSIRGCKATSRQVNKQVYSLHRFKQIAQKSDWQALQGKDHFQLSGFSLTSTCIIEAIEKPQKAARPFEK